MVRHSDKRSATTDRRARSLARAIAGPLVMAATIAGCSETTAPDVVRTFDRPSAISFSCYGEMRVTHGFPAEPGQAVVQSPMPVAACTQWNQGTPPPGQGELEGGADTAPSPPSLLGFVLQSAQGSVAVVEYDLDIAPIPRLQDPDRFIPGRNTIPVGTLPVDIATDPSGCYVLTANAGSCDLSALEVASAIGLDQRPAVRRIAVTNAAGERIGAKPHSMVADPGTGTIGAQCPAKPEGVVYIAYPDCNLVAVVAVGTGEILAGIAFREDGTVEITDGDVGCAAQCGGVVAPPESAAARPVALALEDETLYIGAEDSAALTVVELDDKYHLPTAVSSIPLEGDVGITSLAVSEPVTYQGAGDFRFAYAVATDGTVRVIEVDRELVECDTQVDTRYLHDVRDVSFLPCMPVGDERTPPRRQGARSPGIHMPGQSRPLDVAFAAVDNTDEQNANEPPSPLLLKGYFAYVTTTNGRVVMVNVDDQRYPDVEPVSSSDSIDIALGLAHQIRDFGSLRGETWETCTPPDTSQIVSSALQPRLETDVVFSGSGEVVAQEKSHLLPAIRRVVCTEDDTATTVSELSIMAGMAGEDIRRAAYPDLSSVPVEEEWDLIWEGPLSLDAASEAVDGPQVRRGFFDVDEAGAALVDSGAPFCKMGVEPYDILVLSGCDPEQEDGQCRTGETCYVDPEAPASVRSGLCVPTERVEELAATCSEVLGTHRRYTVTEAYGDRLELAERRRVLRTTPLDGCTSAEQCADLYRAELALATPDHPVDVDVEVPAHTWACEPDPSRAPGPDRCVMTCESSADCEEGYACSGGYCVEGVLPPAECVATSQRYQVRVGEAFSVIGSVTGFLHDRIADPDTGACVADPDAHPLARGRLPLTAPPCEGDGLTDVTPNPCAVTTEHAEIITEWDTTGGVCEDPTDMLVSRETQAIRFRNPVFTLHLVEPQTAGDAQCNHDRGGTGAPFTAVFPGYRMGFRVVGGHAPGALTMNPVDGSRRLSYPAAITRGPHGRMWVMDQGDRSSSIRGQVLWFDPVSPVDLSIANYMR